MITITGRVFDFVDQQNPDTAYCSCLCAEEDGVEDVSRIYEEEYKERVKKEGYATIGVTCNYCGAVLDCFGDGLKSEVQVKSPIFSDAIA